MSDEIRKFIKHLYPNLHEIGNVAIWTLPGSETAFFSDPAEAAYHVDERCRKLDVYMGMGLIGHKPPLFGRGNIEDIIGIGGFCADIDWGKPGYATDQESALKIVNDVGLEPTYIFNTGHGLHVWWLFTEVWLFDDNTDKDTAIKLSKQWNLTVRACALASNYNTDAVGDLTRVMRLPGTFNHKDPAEVKKVTTIKSDPGIRYNCYQYESDFDEFLIDVSCMNPKGIANITVEPVVLNPDAEVSAQKLDSLISNDKKFKDTWKRDRPDLPDQSASSYDMAIANFCAYADNWSDQEIANAIIMWRRKNGNDEEKAKSMRRDYIMRTIFKARTDTAREKALTSIENDLPVSCDEHGDIDDEGHAQILKEISDILMVSVKDFIQLGREQSIYTLVLSNGRQIRIGKARDLRNQSAVWEALLDDSKVVRSKLKPAQWLSVISRLMKISNTIDFEDANLDSDTIGWIAKFLQNRKILRIDYNTVPVMPSVREPLPMQSKERLYIHADSLREYINVYCDKELSKLELYDRFRRLDFTRRTMNIFFDGHKTTRAYWFTSMDYAKQFLPGKPKYVDKEAAQQAG